jgi:WD40 repeat protein
VGPTRPGQRGGSFGEPLNCHTDRVLCVAFGRGPERQLLLASGGSDGTVRLWDPVGGWNPGWRRDFSQTREWLLPQPIIAHTRAVSSVAFGGGSDSRMLASASEDGTVRLWPLTYEGIRRPLTIHTGQVMSVAFGVLGGFLLLASGAFNGTVQLWNPATGRKFGPPLTGHTGRIQSVTFTISPDGRELLVSGSDDQTVRLWDIAKGSIVAVLRRRSSVYSVAAKGAILAIGDAEGVSVIELIKLPGSTG